MSVIGVVVCSVFIAIGLGGLFAVNREYRLGRDDHPVRSHLGALLVIVFFGLMLLVALFGSRHGWASGGA